MAFHVTALIRRLEQMTCAIAVPLNNHFLNLDTRHSQTILVRLAILHQLSRLVVVPLTLRGKTIKVPVMESGIKQNKKGLTGN